jgi:hypothetical protein
MAFKIKDGVKVGVTDVFNNSGTLLVNAPTATKWTTARDLSLTGDGTATLLSVDGTANVSAALTLATVNSNVGTFGTQTAIPVVTVNAKGLVTAVSTQNISTTLGINGNSGTGSVSLLSQSLTVSGGTGVTAAASNQTITISIGQGVATTDNVTFNNLTLSGNLTVNGTTTTVNSVVTTLSDPILTLGGANAPSSNDSKDRGIEFRWHNGTAAKLGFFGFDDSTGKFGFVPDATNTSEVFSGIYGGAIFGSITGSTSAGDNLVLESTSNATKGLVLIQPNGGSVAVGTSSPSASAVLDLTSTTKGLLPPRVTTTEQNAIATPSAGLIVYNTTLGAYTYYNGSAWKEMSIVGGANSGASLANPVVTGLTLGDGSFVVEGSTANDFETTVQFTDPTADRTITIPDITGTLITNADTGTIVAAMLASDSVTTVKILDANVTAAKLASDSVTTVKILDANVTNSKLASDSVTTAKILDGNVTNAKLANSTISGIALGNNLAALTIGTGLTGTSYNGSTAVTITIDSTVATLTGTQILSNKTLQDHTLATSIGVNVANRSVVQASVSSTSATAVDTWAVATYRSAKYIVQITQGSNYQLSEILVIHNGTTVTTTEYGILETNANLGEFTADISGGNVRLLITMGSATAATIKIVKEIILV